MRRAFWIVMLGWVAGGCSRTASLSAAADASAQRSITVHVPGALRVARAIDSLSAEIDPASRADATVNVDAGMTVGIEAELHVFLVGASSAIGSSRPQPMARGDFDVAVATWTTARDGIPQPDKKYVVEMNAVLFETDVAPAATWDPHAGHFIILMSRSLRQAEE